MDYRKIALMLCAICFSNNALADFEDAKNHYSNQEFDKSFQELSKLAQLGHIDAQYLLGESYENGSGVDQDIAKAYSWYLIARDNKHPLAKKKYSKLRREVPSRREAKAVWKSLNAKYGKSTIAKDLYPTPRSVSIFNDPFTKTHDVAPDFPTAVTDGKVSAWSIIRYDINENGKVDNIKVLAELPKSGLSPYAIKAMKQWEFEPPTDVYGDPSRYEGLTIKYQTTAKKNQIRKKFERLNNKYVAQVKHYRDLADSYYQYRYGLLIEHGIIKDKHSALHYYQQSAVNGYSEAQFRLAQCTLSGSLCEKDQSKGVNWLKHAAEKKHIKASYRLAKEYLNYENVDYSPRKAVALLKESSKKGYMPAIVQYASMLALSDDEDIRNPNHAIELAESALAKDATNPQLLSTLGVAYSEMGELNKGEALLNQAIEEASRRKWSTDNYLDLLEDYKTSMFASDN